MKINRYILCFHIYLFIFVWFFCVPIRLRNSKWSAYRTHTHFEIMIHASIYLFAPFFWIMYLDHHLQFLCIHNFLPYICTQTHTQIHEYKVFHILFIYFIIIIILFTIEIFEWKMFGIYYFFSIHFTLWAFASCLAHKLKLHAEKWNSNKIKP